MGPTSITDIILVEQYIDKWVRPYIQVMFCIATMLSRILNIVSRDLSAPSVITPDYRGSSSPYYSALFRSLPYNLFPHRHIDRIFPFLFPFITHYFVGICWINIEYNTCCDPVIISDSSKRIRAKVKLNILGNFDMII